MDFSIDCCLAQSLDCAQSLDSPELYLCLCRYGARAQYRDIEGLKAPDSQLHEFARKMDAEYGEGGWLVVYGGDPFQPDKPDVAHVSCTTIVIGFCDACTTDRKILPR